MQQSQIEQTRTIRRIATNISTRQSMEMHHDGLHCQTTAIKRTNDRSNVRQHSGHCRQTHEIRLLHTTQGVTHVRRTRLHLQQGSGRTTWTARRDHFGQRQYLRIRILDNVDRTPGNPDKAINRFSPPDRRTDRKNKPNTRTVPTELHQPSSKQLG